MLDFKSIEVLLLYVLLFIPFHSLALRKKQHENLNAEVCNMDTLKQKE